MLYCFPLSSFVTFPSFIICHMDVLLIVLKLMQNLSASYTTRSSVFFFYTCVLNYIIDRLLLCYFIFFSLCTVSRALIVHILFLHCLCMFMSVKDATSLAEYNKPIYCPVDSINISESICHLILPFSYCYCLS